MPGLRIPPEHQHGLRKLYSLSSEQTANFLSAIESAAGKAKVDIIDSSTLPDVPGIARSDATEILETIISLYRVRADADVSIDEFVSDLSDFLRSPDSEEFRILDSEVKLFEGRLIRLLSISSLNVLTKAAILRYEQERTLCKVRVLTDARPVFANDVTEPPSAMVVFHMLKIAYHDAQRIREIFFSLDEDDLANLRDAVSRAEAKAESLKQALVGAGIKVIS